jgi:hypothetical protein
LENQFNKNAKFFKYNQILNDRLFFFICEPGGLGRVGPGSESFGDLGAGGRIEVIAKNSAPG